MNRTWHSEPLQLDCLIDNRKLSAIGNRQDVQIVRRVVTLRSLSESAGWCGAAVSMELTPAGCPLLLLQDASPLLPQHVLALWDLFWSAERLLVWTTEELPPAGKRLMVVQVPRKGKEHLGAGPFVVVASGAEYVRASAAGALETRQHLGMYVPGILGEPVYFDFAQEEFGGYAMELGGVKWMPPIAPAKKKPPATPQAQSRSRQSTIQKVLPLVALKPPVCTLKDLYLRELPTAGKHIGDALELLQDIHSRGSSLC
ncbi:hypothetical protein CYMTET_32283, partial [Cymbomonas tetramitiformis]